jgi:undecaprenyl-diphosphatase
MGFVGNCRHEPHGLAPSWRPRLDDGRLDVRLLLADVPGSRTRLVLAGLTGRLPSSRAYAEYVVSELRVESSGDRLRLARDGEHFNGRGSFTIEKRTERLVVYARHEPGALPPRSNRAGL